MDRNCLSYWFPALEAGGIPVPRTRIVRTDLPLDALLDGDTVPGLDGFLADLDRAVAGVGGYPAFLRTGHTSGKHAWRRTCHLPDRGSLAAHVCALVEHSALADSIGLPTRVWAVRGLLPTAPAFRAFEGTPITREYRYFVRDGVVEGCHFSWPDNAIRGADVPDWRPRLAALGSVPPEQMGHLGAMTGAVGRLLPGYWSVDWLHVPGRGWYCIDMAEGDRSWRPGVGDG